MHCFHQLTSKSALLEKLRVAKHLTSVFLNKQATMEYCITGLRAAWCINYLCSVLQGAKVQGKSIYLQHFKLFGENCNKSGRWKLSIL